MEILKNYQNIPNTSEHKKTWNERYWTEEMTKPFYYQSIKWKTTEYNLNHVFDVIFLDYLCKKTIRYGTSFTLSAENIYKHLETLLLLEYHPLPSRRMWWETRSDFHLHLISMKKSRVEQIRRFLHFNDNSVENKVSPFINHFNQCFQNTFSN